MMPPCVWLGCIILARIAKKWPMEAQRIPLEDFFRNPAKLMYRLSPDGTRLAWLEPWEGRMNLFVAPLQAETLTQGEPRRLTDSRSRDIPVFFWKGDNWLVFLNDTDGDENFRVYAVPFAGGETQCLTPQEGVRAEIIDDLEDDPQHLLIGQNERQREIFDVYRLNVASGEREMVLQNPGNLRAYITDHAGKLRVAVATDGVNTSLLYRPDENSEFNTILETDFRTTVSPEFFTLDNNYLYALSNQGRDKTAVVMLNPEDGNEMVELFDHEEVDIAGLTYSKKRKTLTAARYEVDKPELHFFDPEAESLYFKFQQAFPNWLVNVVSHNKEEDRFILRLYNDRSLGAYWLYDQATDTYTELAQLSPWLPEEDLCKMEPIAYHSRDGWLIKGYLTLPQTDKPEAGYPVVINPHGGPWARDSWGYNPEVQFLANRGFAVLQMNFRGSTGYGRAFWEASFKEWGQKMQDDITDGVNWLIREELADSNKVGIYGGSYGGYATLAGLTFTPSVYACGVDYVGVSNLFTFLETIPPYWKPYLEMMYEMVGHPKRDKEMLEAASPVFHVRQIVAPLLVAQGAKDPRVAKSESDQIVEALQEKGVKVEYIVKQNEGHGFRNEENKFDFYRAMERFLLTHLG